MRGSRLNITSQYSTSVTTGQTQDAWVQQIKVEEPERCARGFPSFSEPECNPIIQTGAKAFDGACNAVDTTRNGSDSMESMQQHVSAPDPPHSDPDSLYLSETEESGEEEELRGLGRKCSLRSTAGPHSPTKVGKEKKKVGRPIAYRGDPDSPALTEQERRRIKRRIANRESARRVRYKRQEVLDDLQVKIDCLQSQNADLRVCASESRKEKEEMSHQLEELTTKYKALVSTNANMHTELEALRNTLQMRMVMLEKALDKQDDLPEEKSLFGSIQAQSPQNPGYSSQPTFPFSQPGDFKGSYSFQMALDNFPSMPLERSQELFGADNPDLNIFKTTNPIVDAKPSELS